MTRDHTSLLVPRGHLVAWDVPVGASGTRHTPTLAAVAARYLADRRSRTLGYYADRNHWVMKHRLQAEHSCFSFWAPRLTATALEGLGVVAQPRPDSDLLAMVKRDHRVLTIRQADDPSTAIGRALHAAAWGEHDCPDASGDESALADIGWEDLSAYLGAVVPQACLTVLDDPTTASPGASGRALAESQLRSEWRAGTELVDKPWSQLVVGVAVAFAPDDVDEATLSMMSEVLGRGSDGLLAAELRGARGLAYGVGAAARMEHGCGVLSACANTDRGNVVECMRVLLEVVSRLPQTPPDEWRAAARRLAWRTAAALDHPFTRLDEFRRTSLGQMTLRELLDSLNLVTDGLIEHPPMPLDGSSRALVGQLDKTLRRQVGQWT